MGQGKDREWIWETQQATAFRQIQATISETTTLAYFDVNKPVVLMCDSSKDGIGAACLEEGKPIAFASRAMMSAETRYAQIEKELAAVVFACTKFHDYIYGKYVTVETDHQPLVTIIKKPLAAAPTRLQRLLMRLGRELYVADALSRAYPKDGDASEATEDSEELEVLSILPVSDAQHKQLIQATAEDPTCQMSE